jgi:hypothetical protein
VILSGLPFGLDLDRLQGAFLALVTGFFHFLVLRFAVTWAIQAAAWKLL